MTVRYCPKCKSTEIVAFDTQAMCTNCEYSDNLEDFQHRLPPISWKRLIKWECSLWLLGVLLIIVPMRFYNYNSEAELADWLTGDLISERPYVLGEYECRSYAWDTADASIRGGHVMIPFPCRQSGQWHMRGVGFVGNHLYWVEPQEDTYWKIL